MADEKVLKEIYYDILRTLFTGRDSALSKFSRVRHTYREMVDLRLNRKVPDALLSPGEKKYFSERFLNGKSLEEASREEIIGGIKSLRFAVGMPTATSGIKASGCYAKCCKLMKELNKVSEELGIQKVKEIDSFIDFFTYCPEIQKGDDGLPISNDGLEVVEFYDRIHREKFRREMEKMFNKNRIESVYEIISRFYLDKAKKAAQEEKGV